MSEKPFNKSDDKKGLDYKSSGVDIEVGDELVDWLTTAAQKYRVRPQNIKDGIGGFASIYRFPFPQMKKPCLVSSTDGVGTKVKLAEKFDAYETLAQDLVGMCVNDLVCVGATPLYFLDYFATGKLEKSKAQAFLKGLYQALSLCDCDLIGGETAEMPGVYAPGDFDCAGFVTGVVDEDLILGAHRVSVGDRIFALKSSGFHSNGFSLLRKVFAEDLDENKEILVRPTRLYYPFLKAAQKTGLPLNALAHITGGGLSNIPRVLPKNTQAKIQKWQLPQEFKEVQRRTQMKDEDFFQVLNCGIGLVVILPANAEQNFRQVAKSSDYEFIDLGQVEVHSGDPVVNMEGIIFR